MTENCLLSFHIITLIRVSLLLLGSMSISAGFVVRRIYDCINAKFCGQYGVMENETNETSTSGCGKELIIHGLRWGHLIMSSS